NGSRAGSRLSKRLRAEARPISGFQAPERCSLKSAARSQLISLFVPIASPTADPSNASFERFDREWPRRKPLHLRLMFNSAVRTFKPHRVRPDASQGRVVDVKLKIDP